MTVNVHNIESVITAKLNGTLTDDEILLYAKAIEQLRTGSVFTVDIVSQLPNVNSVPDGALYFVEADRVLYRADRSLARWIGFTAARQIWSWGFNASGHLGDGTTVSRSSPVSVIGGFTDWSQISAGLGSHNLAVRTNGTLWSWGFNNQGQLGDGTVTTRSSPVSVVGGFTDWCRVAAGFCHSIALRSNGTLWSWGLGSFGRLGDGTITDRSSPVTVVGGFTDWSQISTGGFHSLAVRTNGTLWSWGNNGSGRLGDGTITDRSSPVSVIGGFTDWSQISAGDGHSLAVRTNGTLWSWGLNSNGQLGHGGFIPTDRSSPVSVVGGITDWCRIAAGGGHNLAIRSNGTAWSWGCNGSGRLGDGTITTRFSPVSVVGGFTDWSQVSGGSSQSAALRANGTLWTWGSNSNGQLGHDTATTCSRSSPVSVVGGITDWSQIAAGGGHSLAIRISG